MEKRAPRFMSMSISILAMLMMTGCRRAAPVPELRPRAKASTESFAPGPRPPMVLVKWVARHGDPETAGPASKDPRVLLDQAHDLETNARARRERARIGAEVKLQDGSKVIVDEAERQRLETSGEDAEAEARRLRELAARQPSEGIDPLLIGEHGPGGVPYVRLLGQSVGAPIERALDRAP